MQRRLALVTGANSGVGKETTRALAREGWSVVMLCRSLDRGRATLEEIRAEDLPGTLHLRRLDLDDLDQVREAAAEIGAWLDETDQEVGALVNNAGVYRAELERTAQGFERTLGVNHLGHFLFTLLLEAKLRRGGVRIVNVSSEGHRRGKLLRRPLAEIFQGRGRYGGVQAYCDSKLANVLFTEELQRRWGSDGVSVAAVHPGTLATAIWDRNPTLLMWIIGKLKRFMGDPQDGGRYVARLVHDVPPRELEGAYFNRDRRDPAEAPAGDPEFAAALWRFSEEATGLA
ncbi:MAG TPA: SDR family NAD(P)-dependent oxidoreductase [Longimicrobiales bacterium]|nr:SDR family NAD(P)-dependent oxidoreductase [Longimicrobiales bacterium]